MMIAHALMLCTFQFDVYPRNFLGHSVRYLSRSPGNLPPSEGLRDWILCCSFTMPSKPTMKAMNITDPKMNNPMSFIIWSVQGGA